MLTNWSLHVQTFYCPSGDYTLTWNASIVVLPGTWPGHLEAWVEYLCEPLPWGSQGVRCLLASLGSFQPNLVLSGMIIQTFAEKYLNWKLYLQYHKPKHWQISNPSLSDHQNPSFPCSCVKACCTFNHQISCTCCVVLHNSFLNKHMNHIPSGVDGLSVRKRQYCTWHSLTTFPAVRRPWGTH